MELAGVPEVSEIVADRVLELIEPEPAAEVTVADEVEWGVEHIRAHEVWEDFGVRGGNTVVGIIDTGTRHTHEALVDRYRGHLGNGTFDHDHNWFDPYDECPDPSEPCDNHGHGSHVTGTAVGWDGAENRIGVAPGAEWISARGCSDQGACLIDHVLMAGQFMLAPTDTDGLDPRPDLRPHVVNNSWGASIEDDLFHQMVRSWVAAGMFPAFAIGNSGPDCETAGRPGLYPEAFGVGAYNVDGDIANFSSRGPAPSPFEGIQPNISAPGVGVRSARGSGDGVYGNSSGTSMASPHVAGSVALLWSAVPELAGDIDTTREILGRTAAPVEDLTCGGTAENNNVWGQGQLDIHAAVEHALEPVTPHTLRVNVGGGEYVDGAGDMWEADREFGSGEGDLDWGYVTGRPGANPPRTTDDDIDGTDDPELYSSQREDLSAYRVEVPDAGWYDITLHFAELQHGDASRRIFTVQPEGGTGMREANDAAVEALRQEPSDVDVALAALQSAGLTNYDIFAAVGAHTADTHEVRVHTDDETLTVMFDPAGPQHRPVLNAITVTGTAAWQD